MSDMKSTPFKEKRKGIQSLHKFRILLKTAPKKIKILVDRIFVEVII